MIRCDGVKIVRPSLQRIDAAAITSFVLVAGASRLTALTRPRCRHTTSFSDQLSDQRHCSASQASRQFLDLEARTPGDEAERFAERLGRRHAASQLASPTLAIQRRQSKHDARPPLNLHVRTQRDRLPASSSAPSPNACISDTKRPASSSSAAARLACCDASRTSD